MFTEDARGKPEDERLLDEGRRRLQSKESFSCDARADSLVQK